MTWKKWYLTGAAESEDPFICTLLCVMRKAADLSDFDRGQIAMAQRLSTSIFCMTCGLFLIYSC